MPADLKPPLPKESKSLAVVAVAAGLIALFALMAALALRGEPYAFDREILLALRRDDDPSVPIGPAWLRAWALELTTLAGTPILTVMTVTLAGYLAMKRHWNSVGLLLAATIGESILANLLKALFGRMRPDFVPHLVEATSSSFPSGHSASAAAIYLTLAALVARETKDRRVRGYVYGAAVALALVIGATRIYLGVHYPTDVIGGLAFGAAWAALVVYVSRRLGRR